MYKDSANSVFWALAILILVNTIAYPYALNSFRGVGEGGDAIGFGIPVALVEIVFLRIILSFFRKENPVQDRARTLRFRYTALAIGAVAGIALALLSIQVLVLPITFIGWARWLVLGK